MQHPRSQICGREGSLRSVTPVLTSITPDNGASASDLITNVGAITISGTSGANAMITVVDNSVTYGTTTADASGHWSLAVTFAEGSYQPRPRCVSGDCS